MTVTAIVQARMGSTRLPGKVLADVGGRPLLQFLLERLQGLPFSHLVVATSDAAGDDAVADVASAAGAAVVRGAEHDVLERFRQAATEHPADTLIRLTADCPLVDPQVIASVVAAHHTHGADYTSNTLVRTYPDGLDVEVMASSALMAAAEEAVDPVEREHVTPFVYRRPERFVLAAERCTPALGDERWTVDTAEDLAFIRSVVDQVPPAAGWRAILDRIGRRSVADEAQPVIRPAGLEDLEVTGPWVRRHLHHPAVRTWIAELDRAAIGWLRVAVTGGVGTLHTGIEPRLLPTVLPAFTAVLEADHQVGELQLSSPWPLDDGAMAAAGFLPRADRGYCWVR